MQFAYDAAAKLSYKFCETTTASATFVLHRGPFACRNEISVEMQVFDTEGTHDTDAGKCLATFAQLGFLDKGDVSSLLFSPDGQRLYSGASDGTVAAWKLTAVSPSRSQAGLRSGFL